MPGATRSIEVDAPPSALYAVITDYARYPEFLPDVEAIDIIERGEHTAVVQYSLNLIKRVHYTIRLTEVPNTSVTWTLVKSRWMKSNDGGWQLEELPGGRTRATYSLDVGVGRFVPQRIVDRLTGTTLPATLQAFKERAESRA